MKFQLIIASDEDGYRWVSHDITSGYDIHTNKGRLKLATDVIDKMQDSAARAASRGPEPKHETCQEVCGHTHDHDCFAPENEYFTMHGNSTYTSCVLCRFPISAG